MAMEGWTASNMPLLEHEVASFRQDGYWLYHSPLYADDALADLERIFAELWEAAPNRRADEFDTPHFHDERLLRFLLAPTVLDLVESILGPKFYLWSSHFIGKEPRIGRATPWHQDSAYWAGRLDRYDQIVTVWLALDDVDADNGCMQVIPGSHLGGDFSTYRAVDGDKNLFTSEIADLDTSTAVRFELHRGECSLHDGRMVHGAAPNTSDRRRLGYTMRYVSAETTIIPERNIGHRLWLARDRAADEQPTTEPANRTAPRADGS
jgi:ectoine hydroxylase-related dioxygenase (phytanoyl-CoA dioxygenase family)